MFVSQNIGSPTLIGIYKRIYQHMQTDIWCSLRMSAMRLVGSSSPFFSPSSSACSMEHRSCLLISVKCTQVWVFLCPPCPLLLPELFSTGYCVREYCLSYGPIFFLGVSWSNFLLLFFLFNCLWPFF